MPTANELVPNRPLPGSDLAKIILADCEKLLAADGMLTPHCAYGRISYTVRVTLHLDNPSAPNYRSEISSKRRATAEVAANPPLGAIEPAPPLADASPTAVLAATESHRVIDSPNLARMEHGIPVTVERRDMSGHVVEEQLRYPAAAAEGVTVPPTIRDATLDARRELATEHPR